MIHNNSGVIIIFVSPHLFIYITFSCAVFAMSRTKIIQFCDNVFDEFKIQLR